MTWALCTEQADVAFNYCINRSEKSNGIIQHYKKLIEREIKLLLRMNKKTEEIIERKQITETERHKRLFTTKLDKTKQLKTKMIKLKYIKDKEDAREKQLDGKLEMLKNQLGMQESQIIVRMEDESSKRHMREEQERIQFDKNVKEEIKIEKKKL